MVESELIALIQSSIKRGTHDLWHEKSQMNGHARIVSRMVPKLNGDIIWDCPLDESKAIELIAKWNDVICA